MVYNDFSKSPSRMILGDFSESPSQEALFNNVTFLIVQVDGFLGRQKRVNASNLEVK
jgi:hypothetical protein